MFVYTVTPLLRRKLTIALSMLAALFLARIGLLWADRAVPATAGSQPLRQVLGTGRTVALTFEVAWGEDVPVRVLEILRRHRVKATFFVPGRWAEGHPDLVGRMRAEGHEVGSLGMTATDLSRRPPADIREELRAARKAIQQAAGAPPRFLRPPGGRYNEAVLGAAQELGATVTLWSLDSHDWATPGPDYITRRVLRSTGPGYIVRLQAGDNATDTPEALPAILAGLKEKGYRLATLSELVTALRVDGD